MHAILFLSNFIYKALRKKIDIQRIVTLFRKTKIKSILFLLIIIIKYILYKANFLNVELGN